MRVTTFIVFTVESTAARCGYGKPLRPVLVDKPSRYSPIARVSLRGRSTPVRARCTGTAVTWQACRLCSSSSVFALHAQQAVSALAGVPIDARGAGSCGSGACRPRGCTREAGGSGALDDDSDEEGAW